ncbi:TetR/AcrR family transcriptional regulator [Pontibacter akesuensis]|uniref:Transcriptional regulator, TetR family n=1 Tax=Pontibacter akesuensis TaxID=388950 RepID=A0A1I7ICT3_9BACT|nr:TetR/AcrR family transcriptional regulator [Pontibacter akesuensis]GHA66434.1 TetR family transcriptional regulator [Pontibacter akesuensis]SFU70711.1 transcriptional regulator, TetR family [Pontibacter akesuensis]
METAEKTEAKDKILQAAFEMFCQRGIKSVSMDDIAQHLSMSKKTLYKWFRNKDQVIYEAIEGFLGSVQQDCECFIETSGNAIEELFQIVDLSKRVFSNMHPSIFYDLQKYHPDSWNLWMQHKNAYILEKVRENILRGMKEGLFRRDLDVEVMARMRLVLIELPFNQLVFPPHQYDARRVQLAVLEHYMLGIATLKGHKLINELKHITEEE